jgi:hypothetical protein
MTWCEVWGEYWWFEQEQLVSKQRNKEEEGTEGEEKGEQDVELL